MDEPVTIDFARIASELSLSLEQVSATVALLDEGNTIPFITRYRKERTGNLDEEQILGISKRAGALRQLAERAEAICRLIDVQGKLTPELKQTIEKSETLKRLEDLYLPYRPKRRSRATAARERGLEPLADAIWRQDAGLSNLEAAASAYVDAEKELPGTAEVLQGAADILAERISEDAEVRARCRRIAARTGKLVVGPTSKGKEGGQEYRDYFDYSESLDAIPPHRALALNRGDKSGALRVRFEWDSERAVTEVLINLRLTEHRFGEFARRCVSDAMTRLVQPSLERELRRELTDRAEEHAVEVFAKNLRNLLLQPPLQGERVVAIDPGFRTGCKLAALNEFGQCQKTDLIYVTGSAEKRAAAQGKLAAFLQGHECTLVAIGNGTACRETEELVSQMIAELLPNVRYLIVNEAGASIYSTSAVARTEFPDYDATIRGTISIGRRLQDPLSELVKIEPQHIGVGMYQHDITPRLLRESLETVVESCVNYVGVDLNTASASLLRHVSGFSQLIAQRVVEWRDEHGRFAARQQLLDVAGIGDATFTQAAGFLKITGGGEPLDGTWIHPESYEAAGRILGRLSISPEQSAGGPLVDETDEQNGEPSPQSIDAESLAAELGIGLPTCRDILEALSRPGRDPRTDSPGPVFKKGVLKLEDLHEGLDLTGTVLNVVDFGAFVDIGLKDSGLVHVSQMSDTFIASPHERVSVGDVVTVWVLAADQERRRVSLTMLDPARPKEPKSKSSRSRRRRKKKRAAGESPT